MGARIVTEFAMAVIAQPHEMEMTNLPIVPVHVEAAISSLDVTDPHVGGIEIGCGHRPLPRGIRWTCSCRLARPPGFEDGPLIPEIGGAENGGRGVFDLGRES